MDVNRLRVGRFVRCPKCRASFQSMRLAHQSCPECAHSWEVESRRGLFERARDRLGDIGGGAVLAIMWMIVVGFIVGVFAGLYFLVERASDGGGLPAVILVLLLLSVLVGYGIWSRGAFPRAFGHKAADQYLRDDNERTDRSRRTF